MKALDKEKERKKKAHSNLRFQGSYLKYHQHVLLLEKEEKRKNSSSRSTIQWPEKKKSRIIFFTKKENGMHFCSRNWTLHGILSWEIFTTTTTMPLLALHDCNLWWDSLSFIPHGALKMSFWIAIRSQSVADPKNAVVTRWKME